MPELLGKGILIKIILRKTGDHPQVHFTEMAAIRGKNLYLEVAGEGKKD
jgi:hypothetical protein